MIRKHFFKNGSLILATLAMLFSSISCKNNGNNSANEVKSLSFTLSTDTIYVGSSDCVIKDVVIEPDSLENKEVTFYAENPNVASIAGYTISGLMVGVTNIIGVLNDDLSIHYSLPISVVEVPPVEVTGIELSIEKNSIYVGETLRADVSVLPYDATNQQYRLEASNDNVSIVNNKISGVKAGPVSITAYSVANSSIKSLSANLVVKNVPATDIELSAGATNLLVGESTTITANVLPNNAFDKEVEFKIGSGKEDTIRLSGNTVTAVASGTDSIVAYLKSNPSIITELFFVVTNVEPTGIDVSASKTTLYLDESIELNCTVYPNNGFNYDVTFETLSGNNNVISISNSGVVTALSAGEETIVAYLTQRPSIKTTLKITVLNETNPDDPFGDDIFTEE